MSQSNPLVSQTQTFCLVFMRTAFGSTPNEQTDNAQRWIASRLGADYVVATRIYFHGHFANSEKLQTALLKSKKEGSSAPFQPVGSICLQKNCGHQQVNVEARIKRAGLDYSSVRRWILANKRLILTDEVFRDATKEQKEKKEEKQPLSMDQVKKVVEQTHEKLGYKPEAEGNKEHVEDLPPAVPVPAPAPVPVAAPAPAPVKKPAGGLKVYVKSRAGQSWDPAKVNQDRPLACVPLRGHPGVHVYGVMDGHGQHGHFVSEFVMHQLPAFLAAEKNLRSDTANCMTHAVARMCQSLEESNINLAYSGSTCVFGIHFEKQIYVANIGDSRCVLARENPNGSTPITIALSNDHKPDSPGEMERILAAGGRVCPIPGMDSGPNRVWLSEIDEPGLAMSRSVGDEVSQTVGVISVPEIKVQALTDSDRFLLFASDGIWEFISNEEVVQFIWKHINDPAIGVNQLVQEAVRRWQEDSEQVIDDITVVLVMLR